LFGRKDVPYGTSHSKNKNIGYCNVLYPDVKLSTLDILLMFSVYLIFVALLRMVKV
jgi:hypothetical protein